MPRPQKVPNKTELRRYLERGLTQQQIVDAWLEDSGEKVSRSAIAMAIERYDLKSAHTRPEYPDLLPWRVALEHRYHYDARMLRLEGRNRHGGKLSNKEAHVLAVWKEDLEDAGAVVHYERDTEEGFFWIPRQPDHGDALIDRSNADKPAGQLEAKREQRRESRKPRGGGSTGRRAVADLRRD